MFWFLIISSVLVPIFCNNNLRIINGTNADLNEFPFMVSMQNNSKHICGGTIINQQFILTAAHCVCNVKLVDLRIYATHSIYYQEEDKGIKINVESVICHNYTKLEKINDIALLKLSASIPDQFYNKVSLVSTNFTTTENQKGVLIGWGATTTGGNSSESLKKVQIIVYNDTICRKSYYGMYDMERNMCAGWPDNGRGSCQGDSGGPLLVHGKQAGIISFGISGDCGISNVNHPKVLTRISRYLDWIEANSVISNDNNFATRITINYLFYFIVLLMTLY